MPYAVLADQIPAAIHYYLSCDEIVQARDFVRASCGAVIVQRAWRRHPVSDRQLRVTLEHVRGGSAIADGELERSLWLWYTPSLRIGVECEDAGSHPAMKKGEGAGVNIDAGIRVKDGARYNVGRSQHTYCRQERPSIHLTT